MVAVVREVRWTAALWSIFDGGCIEVRNFWVVAFL